MIFRKKTAVLFSAVIVIALVSAVLFKAGGYISTVTQGAVPERRVIILDAGHGGLTKPYKLPNGKINIL